MGGLRWVLKRQRQRRGRRGGRYHEVKDEFADDDDIDIVDGRANRNWTTIIKWFKDPQFGDLTIVIYCWPTLPISTDIHLEPHVINNGVHLWKVAFREIFGHISCSSLWRQNCPNNATIGHFHKENYSRNHLILLPPGKREFTPHRG